MQGREAPNSPEQTIRELVESSEALAHSLSVHTPHFLEYLEKRSRAVQALAHCQLPPSAIDQLTQALEHGRSAELILRREREKIESEIRTLHQKKTFFHDLYSRNRRSAGVNLEG